MNELYSQEWFKKANKDLKTVIELSSKNDSDYHEIIAFHCQQCVEKYLKGFLVFHNKIIKKSFINLPLLRFLFVNFISVH